MTIKKENKKYYGLEWKKISNKRIEEVGKCEICKKTKKELATRNIFLGTHHKDRDPSNNKRENLLVCCPKHHFQQENLINMGYFNTKQLKFKYNSTFL